MDASWWNGEPGALFSDQEWEPREARISREAARMNPMLLKLALDVMHGEPIHWHEVYRMEMVSHWDQWIRDSLEQVQGSSVAALPSALASLQELVLAAIEATETEWEAA